MHYLFAPLCVLSVCGAWAAQPAGVPPVPAQYPPAHRVDVVDDYHGVQVADPFRWLEDDRSEETAAWVRAQNELTQAYLAGSPLREAIRESLTQLWNYERYSLPSKKGSNYFYSKNNGLQPQSVLYVATSPKDEGQVLLDPNTLKADGTAALAGTSVSHDGKLLAYAIADSGSDWNIWKVRDVATGRDLGDELRWIKFSGASWAKDGSGVLYSRFEEPEGGVMARSVNENPRLHFHRLGQKQEDDALIYKRPDRPTWSFGAEITDDGRYAVMAVGEGTERKNRLYYRDLQTHPLDMKPSEADLNIRAAEEATAERRSALMKAGAAPQDLAASSELEQHHARRADLVKANGGMAFGFVEMLNEMDASYEFIDNEGPTFFILTDLDAPRGRIIAINVNHPEREHWKELVPLQPWTLQGASRVGPRLVLSYLKDACSSVRVHDLDGTFAYEVKLPGVGSAGGFRTDREQTDTFYSYTSYTQPPTLYALDILTGTSSVFRESKVAFDPSQFVSELIFATAKDGTEIPLFVSRRKDVALDGQAPCILYGYGGFGISLTPGFSPVTTQWLKMGGIYAVACIRGGGEYGEEWHQAAVKTKHPVAFDDFIAAGEHLVAQKYTSPARLAIRGGSNGGLLVGACLIKRPDLFGAAIPEVGVMDMLRFHLFTIGWAWKSDYGSSENKDEFEVLNSYSPYHQLLRGKAGTLYPPTLVTTADHDDRVVPGHSFKFAAALQASAPNGHMDPSRPYLIRVETSAGHGAGKPTKKSIDANTDVLAFLARVFNMQPSADH